MATRSTIAVELEDGSIRAVYCHWDGYLSYNGKLLMEHYNSQALAEAITTLGDISSLGERIEPNGPHDFDNAEEGCTVFYGRDRGETNVHPRTFKDYDDYIKNLNRQEYNYLYMDDMWMVEGSKDDGLFHVVEHELLLEEAD